MTDDIVTRLRGQGCPECGLPSTHNQFDEAADEIELLRASVDGLTKLVKSYDADRTRLRKLMSDYVSLWLQVESLDWTYENTRSYYAKFDEMKQAVRGE